VGCGQAQSPPCCTKCNWYIAHPTTASVPITALLYDGPLLCGFNVAIKRLNVYIRNDSYAYFSCPSEYA